MHTLASTSLFQLSLMPSLQPSNVSLSPPDTLGILGHSQKFKISTLKISSAISLQRLEREPSGLLFPHSLLFLIHTYIHNWPLQPFSQDYGLASHSTHVVCVNFMREWRDLQFNVDSERQIFEKLFHGNFIYSQSFCQKSAARKSAKKYFSYSVLMSGLGLESWLFV